jgi:hypothetical protein
VKDPFLGIGHHKLPLIFKFRRTPSIVMKGDVDFEAEEEGGLSFGLENDEDDEVCGKSSS